MSWDFPYGDQKFITSGPDFMSAGWTVSVQLRKYPTSGVNFFFFFFGGGGGGGVVTQSVERATPIPSEEVLGSIPMWPPAPYWLGRCHGLPALSRVWQHVRLSDVRLGTRSRYSLVFDEDIKKPTNQINKRVKFALRVATGYFTSLS